jgi:hypothetical protein
MVGEWKLTMITFGKPEPKQGEVKDHRREAARLRRLAASATTAAMKARLLEQARHEDWLASIEPSGQDTRSTARLLREHPSRRASLSMGHANRQER